MVWTSSQAFLDESNRFVSSLCQSGADLLILISELGPSELAYDGSIAHQYYFDNTKKFLMGLF